MHTPNKISGRAKEKLSDKSVKAFVAKGVSAAGKKLSDGGGMYLTMTPAGSAIWRIKYRFNRAERSFTVGSYPEVGLQAARDKRGDVKAQLREGRDPVQERRIERVEATTSSLNTFAELATAWLEHEKKRKKWTPIHYKKSKRAIERDVLPHLGKLPVAEIEPVMVTTMVKHILARDVRETAAKILRHVTGIFTFAQAHGLRSDNPAAPAQTVLPRADDVNRRPALLEFPELGDVLRSAEAARLSPAVRMAHRLCAFSCARSGNIVTAEWSEFDLESDVATWIIPRSKMKSRKDRKHDHKIILAPAIAEELRKWRGIKGGKGYVFATPAGGKYGHITRESIEKAYRVTLDLGDKHTPHGWRAAFATLARDDEEGKFERDVVELALDHIHDTDVVRAYDRGERLKQRIKLMYWWGEQLVRAERGADVVKLRSA
jgi:integrase